MGTAGVYCMCTTRSPSSTHHTHALEALESWTRAALVAERRRSAVLWAGLLVRGAIVKIGALAAGGAGLRRRTPRSGWEVGVVRAAPARRSGGVPRRARR